MGLIYSFSYFFSLTFSGLFLLVFSFLSTSSIFFSLVSCFLGELTDFLIFFVLSYLFFCMILLWIFNLIFFFKIFFVFSFYFWVLFFPSLLSYSSLITFFFCLVLWLWGLLKMGSGACDTDFLYLFSKTRFYKLWMASDLFNLPSMALSMMIYVVLR